MIASEQILEHAALLSDTASLIRTQEIRIDQMLKSAAEKNFDFYTLEDMKAWRLKFIDKLGIKQAALDRLKVRYINQLNLLK